MKILHSCIPADASGIITNLPKEDSRNNWHLLLPVRDEKNPSNRTALAMAAQDNKYLHSFLPVDDGIHGFEAEK